MWAAAVLITAGCASGSNQDAASQSNEATVGAPIEIPADPDAAWHLLLTDPSLMTSLGALMPVGELFGQSDVTRATGATPKALETSSAAWRDFTSVITSDIDEERTADPQAGIGFAFDHRLFDASWLKKEETSFELVAVVNRIGRCGQPY